MRMITRHWASMSLPPPVAASWRHAGSRGMDGYYSYSWDRGFWTGFLTSPSFDHESRRLVALIGAQGD